MMPNKKIKWLIYTVLVGFIPILSRLLIWIVTNNGTIDLFSPSDFIAFGLVLHISNINEIEHYTDDKSWKTAQNGTSIAFIAIYSVLFSLTILGGVNPVINMNIAKTCAMILALVSFLISYTVYDRLSKVNVMRSL